MTSGDNDELATPRVEDQDSEAVTREAPEDDQERDAIAWNLPAPRKVPLPVGAGAGLPPSR